MKNLNSTKAKELIQSSSDLIILDVRSAAEYNQGYIQNAVNMDINSAGFAENIASLDKTKPYLVYCHAGSRSLAACAVMKDAGFTEIYNLEDGYSEYH